MRHARLELDYVAAPRRPVWLGLLLLAVALGIATDLGLRYRDARAALAEVATQQGLRGDPSAAAPAVPLQRLEEQARAAESVLHQLALPWAALIQVLEASTTADVAVLQVEPQAQQQLLRITAQARDHQAMLRYQGRLAAAAPLDHVYLLSHQTLLDDPQKPLRFTLQAVFKAAP